MSAASDWFIFGSYAFACLGQVSDHITSLTGFEHGFNELNPILRTFALKHPTLMGGIKFGALPFAVILSGMVFGHTLLASFINTSIGAIGFAMGIRNFILLRQKGIKVNL